MIFGFSRIATRIVGSSRTIKLIKSIWQSLGNTDQPQKGALPVDLTFGKPIYMDQMRIYPLSNFLDTKYPNDIATLQLAETPIAVNLEFATSACKETGMFSGGDLPTFAWLATTKLHAFV